MNTNQQTVHSPALRLKRMEAISPPPRPQFFGGTFLVGVGLGIMLATLVGIGIVIGIYGTEPIAEYARQVLELTWPGAH